MSNELDSVPLIGVHALTEFVFCKRSGLICQGQQTEDQGYEDAVSNLDFMPFYELKEIDNALEKLQVRIFWLVGIVAALVLGGALVGIMSSWILAVLVWAVSIIPVQSAFTCLVKGYQLYSAREKFTNIESRIPDLNNLAEEELDWRAIIRFGFDVERCRDPFIDDELGIMGKPWRLLKRNSLCIPVFNCRLPAPKNPESSAPSNWLYQQHYVRIAAYCRLIQKCTNQQAPFGLVLFSKTHRAIAIKTCRETDEALERAITSAQLTMEEYKQGTKPPPPNKRLCRHCHQGRLRTYVYDSTLLVHYGEEVEPRTHLIDNRRQHSHCGDLFRWVPPHKVAIDAGLKEN